MATLEWVSWFNNCRLLGPIGYIPPAEAEANYYRQLAEKTETRGDSVIPLHVAPRTAVFELQYFPGEHSTHSVQLGDGPTLQRSNQLWSDVLKLRSVPILMPS